MVEDTPKPVKPDAVFPNNWFSTHADGRLILYPFVLHKKKRKEKIFGFNFVRSGV
ncbi:arginine deiminase-related protein [Echinicola jeungdonensis]|nr:arginine deiminase-related protein [Echinicola jeungdonensis]MDN3671209.1 arginine deiminase-related protein [Echinicola jeungdonensis]